MNFWSALLTPTDYKARLMTIDVVRVFLKHLDRIENMEQLREYRHKLRTDLDLLRSKV